MKDVGLAAPRLGLLSNLQCFSHRAGLGVYPRFLLWGLLFAAGFDVMLVLCVALRLVFVAALQ